MGSEMCIRDSGCVIPVQAVVDQPAEIVVSLEAESVLVNLGDSTQLQVLTPISGVTYEWSPAEYLSCTDCPNPTVTPTESITYSLVVTDTLTGCQVEENVVITVTKNYDVFIPNAFTPNDDNINDVIMIYAGVGVSTIRSFMIYDRWGELVYEATDFQPNDPLYGWDGRYKGKRLNPAVFVYYAEIEFVDGQVIPFKGDVSLVR